MFKRIFCVAVFFATLFAVQSFAQEKAIAKANKINNLFVFSDCEPICEYEVLARKKARIAWTKQYEPKRNKVIRKLLAETPDADGIMITFNSLGVASGVAIKFNEGQDKEKLALARVSKLDGIYVFSDCIPVTPYKTTDSIKTVFQVKIDYASLRNRLVDKAVKKNSKADGIILGLNEAGIDRAEVIVFE